MKISALFVSVVVVFYFACFSIETYNRKILEVRIGQQLRHMEAQEN